MYNNIFWLYILFAQWATSCKMSSKIIGDRVDETNVGSASVPAFDTNEWETPWTEQQYQKEYASSSVSVAT
jgi:hypothetical protein